MKDRFLSDDAFTQRNLERIKRLRLMDDDFFRVCFKDDKEGAQFILRIILDKQDLVVTNMRTQHSIKNLQGHSVILDVFATDSDKKMYNIEVQRSDTGANPKRARYLSSMIDANYFRPSEDYGGIPQTYVIFITENDVLRENRPIYHIERVITESGNRFNDEAHIVYVNASYNDDTALGKLMHDFNCTDPGEMNYSELRKRAEPIKNDTKEAQKMCEIWEEVRQEGIDIGIKMAEEKIAEAEKQAAEAEKQKAEAEKQKAEAEAKAKAKAEAQIKAEAEAQIKAERAKTEAEMKERATKTAIRMIRRGNLTTEEISEYTGLTQEEVREYIELIAG